MFDKPNLEPMYRGRRSIGVDLKNPEGVELVLRLVEQADALIEGYRPGVTERLGLGPDVCLARNPKLVYGRMTGWGQDGPMAQAAGHDINYIALAGALAHFGRAGGKPTPPINLVGDFGGGGMFMAFGIVCGVLEAQRSGKGQVLDVAMVDGSADAHVDDVGPEADRLLGRGARRQRARHRRAVLRHVRDADGKFVSLGSLEPQFYAELIQTPRPRRTRACPRRWTRAAGTRCATRFTELFKTKTRDEWDAILAGSDACYAPVLTMSEATNNEHIEARKTIIERDGVPQPAPAPRFSRTTAEVQRSAPWPGQHTDEALADWGFDAAEVDQAARDGRDRLTAPACQPSVDASTSGCTPASRASSSAWSVPTTVTWPTLRPGRGALP